MNNRASKKKRSLAIYTVVFIAFICIFVACAIALASLSMCLQGRGTPYSDVFGLADSGFTILIDAGHGGEDGGAVSADGVREKDLNLDIAKKLETFLSMSDLNTVMIRQNDRLMYDAGQENRKKYYDITNRIKTASSYDNALFVSIHQNKFPIRKYSGFQVYFSKNNSESEKLAKITQTNIKIHLQPKNKREAKKADSNIRILDSLEMPAVLAECGFLSNENETALLNTEEYRRKIAYLLYISILQYVNEK